MSPRDMEKDSLCLNMANSFGLRQGIFRDGVGAYISHSLEKSDNDRGLNVSYSDSTFDRHQLFTAWVDDGVIFLSGRNTLGSLRWRSTLIVSRCGNGELLQPFI